jgi:hypothetical protein
MAGGGENKQVRGPTLPPGYADLMPTRMPTSCRHQADTAALGFILNAAFTRMVK